MDDWTNTEKEALLNALNKHGSSDIALLCPYIPTRKRAEVENYILKLSKKARIETRERVLCLPRSIRDIHPITMKRKRIADQDFVLPIDNWLDLAIKNSESPFSVERLAISKVLKLIGEGEPDNDACLREAYNYLAVIIDGNVPSKESEEVTNILRYCLHDLAESVNVANEEIQNFLKHRAQICRKDVRKTYGASKKSVSLNYSLQSMNFYSFN